MKWGTKFTLKDMIDTKETCDDICISLRGCSDPGGVESPLKQSLKRHWKHHRCKRIKKTVYDSPARHICLKIGRTPVPNWHRMGRTTWSITDMPTSPEYNITGRTPNRRSIVMIEADGATLKSCRFPLQWPFPRSVWLQVLHLYGKLIYHGDKVPRSVAKWAKPLQF